MLSNERNNSLGSLQDFSLRILVKLGSSRSSQMLTAWLQLEDRKVFIGTFDVSSREFLSHLRYARFCWLVIVIRD